VAVQADALSRKRAIGHFLTTIQHDPSAAVNPLAWRQALLDLSARANKASGPEAETAASWGAFAAREIQRAAIGVLWASVCELGRKVNRPYGLSQREFLSAVRYQLAAEPSAFGVKSPGPNAATTEFAARLESKVGTTSLDALVKNARQHNGALNALGVLLELSRRLPRTDSMPGAWAEVGHIDGDYQDGLLTFVANLKAHLAAHPSPSIADSVEWLAERYVLAAHDRVATSKLSTGRNTFRFRYDSGRLVFFDSPRIALGDGILRHDPLSLLSRDLDLWKLGPNGPTLTVGGRTLLERAFRE
jgi:hypothetical protein